VKRWKPLLKRNESEFHAVLKPSMEETEEIENTYVLFSDYQKLEEENEGMRFVADKLAFVAQEFNKTNKALRDRVKVLEDALGRIEKWHGEFPKTGRQWNDGTEMSYAAAYGTNGERDYMREIARLALNPPTGKETAQ